MFLNSSGTVQYTNQRLHVRPDFQTVDLCIYDSIIYMNINVHSASYQEWFHAECEDVCNYCIALTYCKHTIIHLSDLVTAMST